MVHVYCLLQGKIMTVSRKTVMAALNREAERSDDTFVDADFSGDRVIHVLLNGRRLVS